MIIHGDCLEEMRKMDDYSISAIVTDPPYGLSFMNKGWDHVVPKMSYWKEAFRIAKPGSFLISMGGTRTFHRLTCEIEDAGWEIRDCISYLYGSGFPKSHNHFGIQGYGTALKPAWEPCILAMKPLDGNFKKNAEKWGQAGINIDECRIDSEPIIYKNGCGGGKNKENRMMGGNIQNDDQFRRKPWENTKGRWPANLILDEEAGKMLDEQNGILKSGGGDKGNKTQEGGYGKKYGYVERIETPSSGGASRFFYCAKASSKERGEGNVHPTVKPLALMEYLIKLVMPPKDGILLDPFAGSGTTIVAAKRLGFEAMGIEMNEEYCEIARRRIEEAKPIKEDRQLDLLDPCKCFFK